MEKRLPREMKKRTKKITIEAGRGGKDRRFDTFKRRIFFIFSRLAQRGQISTTELAAEFEMSTRNALRDLEPLRDQGILKENISRNGIWEFDRTSHSFLKMEITDRDTTTLAFLYKFSKVFGGEINKTVFSVMDKIFDVEKQEYPFFMITQKVKNPAAKMNCYPEIYAAIQARHKINLTYLKGTKKATVKAAPFSIILCDGLWYLGYIPEGKGKALRTLRSSKIVKVEPLETEVFERPDWALEIMKESKNIWFRPGGEKLVLKADNSIKDYFDFAEYFPCQKIVSEGPGSFVIQAKFTHLNEVVPTILRFLPAIMVLEPASVKEEVFRRINEY